MIQMDVNSGAASADADIATIRKLIAQESKQPMDCMVSHFEESSHASMHVDESVKAFEPLKAQTTESTGRATLRIVAVGVILAGVVFRPGIIIIAAVLLLIALLAFIIFLTIVGVDGFWRRTRGVYLWIKARRPTLARRLRRGFYAGARQWSHVADRLPGQLSEAVQAPDFEAAAAAEAAHEKALKKRFARLQEELQAGIE